MTALAYIALGAGLLLVADIIRTGWISRQDARSASFASRRQLSDVDDSRTVLEVMDGLTQKPRGLDRAELDAMIRNIRRSNRAN